MKATAERPHPATPLIRGWVIFFLIIVAIGRELIPDGGERDSGFLDLIRENALMAIGALLIIVMLAALTSFATWWFTRYVVDDEELRIETGLFTKTSKRIPFQRIQSIDVIQPLAARIFGLAELKVDAGNDKSALRYLARRRAYRIRDYLLARAHGQQITVADSERRPQASAARDLAADDQVLVTITPQRLIIGFLTSTDFFVSVVISLFALAAVFGLGLGVYSFGVLVPVIFGTVRMIGGRVLSQFNYTLARTGRGLRTTRGLTNLTSQSIPVDRIQGVRITQYLLWKALGFYRMDIDVLGIHGDADTESSQSGSILLPVANQRELAIGLDAVLPGVRLDDVSLWRCPERARWLHWFTVQTYVWGHDERVAYSRRGLVDQVTNIVPHDKVQSVRITNGPVQRRLRLASVHLDTTPGPVTWAAPDIDPGDARRFAMSQLDRVRAARARRAGAIDPARR